MSWIKTACRAFAAIDAPTQAVLVPYGEGKNIISELCAATDPNRTWELLRQAQQYSVNVFPHVWKKLLTGGAVRPVREDEDIYCLDERHYSPEYGLSLEANA
jgi:CRISPR-associated endonuclease/helicase Cas3